MSKKLNELAMESELAGSAFFGGRPEAPESSPPSERQSPPPPPVQQAPTYTPPPAPSASPLAPAAPQYQEPAPAAPAPAPVKRELPDQPVSRLVSRLVGRPTDSEPHGIVPRPKSFYISVRLDERLDRAVRYFQEVYGIKKADRSTIVNALLDREELWTDEALDSLATRVLERLASRLAD